MSDNSDFLREATLILKTKNSRRKPTLHDLAVKVQELKVLREKNRRKGA